MGSASTPPSARSPREIRQFDRQVWDLVDHLIHPAALYVVFQLVIGSHLGRTPSFAGLEPWAPWSLALYALQFLGAWCVFYTVLLRDMGHPSPEGTILLAIAILGVTLQYLLIPQPSVAPDHWSVGLAALQGIAALVLWPITYGRFVRRRREHRGAAA